MFEIPAFAGIYGEVAQLVRASDSYPPEADGGLHQLLKLD